MGKIIEQALHPEDIWMIHMLPYLGAHKKLSTALIIKEMLIKTNELPLIIMAKSKKP